MSRYIVRRVLYAIPVLIGIILLVFILARVIPGDPCTATYGEKATPQLCAQFEVRYGLNKPIYEQFVIYLGSIVQGDLGSSIRYGRPVTDTLGMVSAIRRNSPADVGTMMFANLGVSVPVFVLGLLLAYIFAVVLKDTPLALPPSGRLSTGVDVVPLAIV